MHMHTIPADQNRTLFADTVEFLFCRNPHLVKFLVVEAASFDPIPRRRHFRTLFQAVQYVLYTFCPDKIHFFCRPRVSQCMLVAVDKSRKYCPSFYINDFVALYFLCFFVRSRKYDFSIADTDGLYRLSLLFHRVELSIFIQFLCIHTITDLSPSSLHCGKCHFSHIPTHFPAKFS